MSDKLPALADPTLRLALTWACALLVGWPLLQIAGARGIGALFLYVFVIWSGLIVVLFAVARSLRRSLPSTASEDHAPRTRP